MRQAGEQVRVVGQPERFELCRAACRTLVHQLTCPQRPQGTGVAADAGLAKSLVFQSLIVVVIVYVYWKCCVKSLIINNLKNKSGGEAGIRTRTTRFSKLMMAKDFWR